MRALDARRGDVARRTYRVIEDVPFDAWADRWLASFTGKENTRRVYAQTLSYSKQVFRSTRVRELTPGDVRRLLDHIKAVNAERTRDGKPSPRVVTSATLAKHLRQLGACLEAAVSEGYATDNPVRKLHKTARPKVAKGRPAFFTDAELARLWPELALRPVYAAMCKTAYGTGMRLGELAALRWTDVDLLACELHVRQTFTEGVGVTTPKSGEARTIDLTPAAAAVLESWLVESGDRGLVFEREEGGFVSGNYLTKQVLYPALKRAGIARTREGGRARTFHSFRHTFARIALEHGAPIDWVRRQLGHSSITLTVDTYGEWSRTAQKAEAQRLAGAFGLVP